jgi:hypothetical protein
MVCVDVVSYQGSPCAYTRGVDAITSRVTSPSFHDAPRVAGGPQTRRLTRALIADCPGHVALFTDQNGIDC